MRKFFERAMEKVPKMNDESIRALLKILADENEKMDTVLDSMMLGIVVCDESHVPSLINKAAERLIPMSSSDLFDVPFWKNIRDPEISFFVEQILIANETVVDREFIINSKTGTKILSLSVTALVKKGKIQGSIIQIDDTTDMRRREARLRRAESLASLTTLAAGVAHEIKNPLGSMSIHVQLLRKALQKCTNEQISHYFDVVSEEIDRLNKIVVDFLFAVRPMDMQVINDDISSLIKEVTEFMNIEIKNANIKLELNIGDSVPIFPFDKRYIKQALINLIKNAIASMPLGGVLSLSAQHTHDELRITISDTGIGISEEKLEKIFEPYYTTKENGTGLGLTLTYKIIKEHGGDVSVRSKLGHGSTFIITLPIPQKEQKLITAFKDT